MHRIWIVYLMYSSYLIITKTYRSLDACAQLTGDLRLQLGLIQFDDVGRVWCLVGCIFYHVEMDDFRFQNVIRFPLMQINVYYCHE